MDNFSLSLFDRLVNVNRSDSTALYEQLYRDLRDAIVDGQLPPDTRFPSSRTLADHLDLSRNTVTNAFDQLRSEGYVYSRVGSGTYVSPELPERHTRVAPPDTDLSSLRLTDVHARSPSLSDRAEQVANLSLSKVDNPSMATAFRPGVPALDAFPIDTWSTLASRRWRTLPPNELVYGDPAGYAPLREAIAEYLRTARGVRCEATQVLIVSGIQQACTLAARVLLNTGDNVYVEDPGFPQLRAAFEAVGATTHPIPVDENGLSLPSDAPTNPPQLVGVTPSHHYPLGMTMPLSRRVELVEWAARHDTWIFEDDYDSEFRYGGEPIAALQGLDNAGRVLYAGTFSKVLFPALRLGYLVVPPDLVDPFVQMRTIADRGSPRINQIILTDFITEGHFEKHIRQMRTLYAARQTALLDAVDREFDGFIEVDPNDAGLHLIGWLPEGVDDRAVSDHLDQHDLVALPLSFYADRDLDRGGLLLGYGGLSEEEIHEEVRRMADALADFQS